MSQLEALKRINNAKKEELDELDLSNLNLSKIPKQISKLSDKLARLDLSKNKLTELTGLKVLTQLSRLNVQANQIVEIKDLENLTKLISLNLERNQLSEIKGLENLTRLVTLKLGKNQFSEIKGLETLTGLLILDLNENQLSEIKGLETLTSLTILSLHGNQINEIKGLNRLLHLKELYLYHNQLQEITGLDRLKNLSGLHLWSNKLTEIKGLENNINLTSLHLSHNQLTEIKGLEKLKKLTHFDFGFNKIIDIPESLLLMGIPIKETLNYGEEGITFQNNPIVNPPLDIVRLGNAAIREYFDQIKKSGPEPLNEAKLILLGDGRSGKTSLANRLLGKPLPQETDRTQGVDIIIGDYSFSLPDGKKFKINIWDFAGQDKYKTLHQLFYTDDSLYVMVAESGNMTTDFDDWFQSAELFGDGSPLILMLNEFKDGIGGGSFDDIYWKKQFPNLLKEVFTINLDTKLNFQIAEDYICYLAQNLPHAKLPFPSNWAAIRRCLNERRNQQYISLNEYLEICKDNNLPEREGALILSSTLHKIGDCLHYRKNPLLQQFLILKNEWATEAVYKILGDRIVAEEKCGFFNIQDVERIWNSDEYRDMRPQLLELMKQFKLAYQLPGKMEFVTPPLLPPGRPSRFLWPEQDSLELYIDYDFLPKALLTQFIVTRHLDIADGKTLVWRHGVILKWDGEALAEISKTKLEGRDAFYIRTQGTNRKEMMTVILNTFRELHADYKGIKYKEKVPCICGGCKNKENKQYYFDFANLKFRLEKGRDEAECNNSLELVDIMSLLENTFIFNKFKKGVFPELKENVTKEKPIGYRILKVFLASSNELADERKEIEQAIGRKNKILRKDGIEIELLIWEDNKYVGKSLRSQDNYNLDINRSNLFVMMFYSKVGKFSLEEYELAFSLFSQNEYPRICIFQKDIDLPKNQRKIDADSRYNFLDKLNKIEHFPTLFNNTDKLVNELERNIDKLLLDKDFVERLEVE